MAFRADARICVCTLHAAKGLEWPLVFLPGWEEQVFPSQRSIDDNGEKGLEEERRLAYVGITRARDHLTLTRATSRKKWGKPRPTIPSRFLYEMTGKPVPGSAVEVEIEGIGTLRNPVVADD